MITDAPPLHLPEFYSPDALPVFERLRRDDPVHEHEYEHGRLWILTRHAEVVKVSRDHQHFSACVPLIRTPATDPINALLQGAIVASDPPAHTAIRSLARDHFSNRAVADREVRMKQYIAQALASVGPGQPFNLISQIAEPLPIFVIGDILGVPVAELEELAEVTEAVVAYADPSTGLNEVGFEALTRCMGFLHRLVERRRSTPARDVVTNLQALDDLEAVKTLFVLLLGGFETTKGLISHGMIALAERPGTLERIHADPSLIPTAIEELLRWTTPISYYCRQTTTDVDLGRRRIPAGEQVVAALISANHDEAVFGPTAAELLIDRDPNPHVAFGFGAHFCIGAHLTRRETTAFFEETLRRFQSVEMAGEVKARVMNSQTRSLIDVPIILT